MQDLPLNEALKKATDSFFEYSYLNHRRMVGFSVSGLVEFICHSKTAESAFTVQHRRPYHVYDAARAGISRAVLKIPTSALEALQPVLTRGMFVKVEGIVRGYERTIECGSKVELLAERITVIALDCATG